MKVGASLSQCDSGQRVDGPNYREISTPNRHRIVIGNLLSAEAAPVFFECQALTMVDAAARANGSVVSRTTVTCEKCVPRPHHLSNTLLSP